jgi:hypothetical protein
MSAQDENRCEKFKAPVRNAAGVQSAVTEEIVEPLPVEELRALPRPLVRFHLVEMVARGKLSPEEAFQRWRSAVGASEPLGP